MIDSPGPAATGTAVFSAPAPSPRLLSVVTLVVTALASSICAAQPVPEPGQPSKSADATDRATDERIDSLIRELGDRSYEKRARASRELCMIGQRAASALQRAASGDQNEVTLRAGQLLEVIDTVYFGGCSVELSAGRSRIAWNDPLEVVLTIHNASDYLARVPLQAAGPDRDRLPSHVRQIGDMVDLGDHLRVVAPDGQQVRVRIDDVRDDPLVEDAIRWRAEGGPLTEIGPAGKSVRRLAEFNSGWARFPLLERGRYSIQLVYEPQWDDDEFSQAGVGSVASNILEIEVTEEAPAIVRNATEAAVLTVERQGPELVAFVTSTSDVSILVNRNLATSAPPFAGLIWTVRAGGAFEDLNLLARALRKVDNFSRERLVELAPGSRMELSRVPVGRLLESATARKRAEGQPLAVRAVWTNLTCAAWQHAERPPLIDKPGTPTALRSPLPPRLLTGRYASNQIEIGQEQPASAPAP